MTRRGSAGSPVGYRVSHGKLQGISLGVLVFPKTELVAQAVDVLAPRILNLVACSRAPPDPVAAAILLCVCLLALESRRRRDHLESRSRVFLSLLGLLVPDSLRQPPTAIGITMNGGCVEASPRSWSDFSMCVPHPGSPPTRLLVTRGGTDYGAETSSTTAMQLTPRHVPGERRSHWVLSWKSTQGSKDEAWPVYSFATKLGMTLY